MLTFLLVILLAVGLGGGLAWWQTTNQFEIFVTEQGRFQATFIASLLEAQHNLHGSLDNINQLLGYGFSGINSVSDATQDEPDASGWPIPAADWWDEVVAAEIGITVERVSQRDSSESIADLANLVDIDPDSLVHAIMLREIDIANAMETEFADEPVFYLADTSLWAHEYVNFSQDAYAASTSDLAALGYFTDERVFVLDQDGAILFDSGTQKGEIELRGEEIEQGVPIIDWRTGEQIGSVLVAAGPDFYDERDRAFLSNMVRSLLIGSLLAVGVALLVSSLLSRQITTPVEAMTAAVTRLAQGETGERLPIKSDDEVGRMSQAFNQLTDSLAAQRQLRHQLVADMSHEINTPLSVIRAEMEGLQYGLQTAEEAAQHVFREVDLLHSLARDLTLLAERDRDELRLDVEPIAMSDFIAAEVDRWQIEAEANGIHLAPAATERDLPPVSVDLVRLSQALGNLIHNGIQHTPAGGQVAVSCERDGDWLKVIVSDTGEGIAAEHLPHIFDRFYRVDSARQRANGGRGLGLAIVRNIIELHEGYVFADSRLGEGSRIGFLLPLMADD